MTGFGTAEGEIAGRRARVEIRTVNHRWFNLATRLPSEFAPLEGELREALRRDFERGHVNVAVHWVDSHRVEAAIDVDRAAPLVAALRLLRERYGLAGDVTVELVARHPELLGASRGHDPDPVAWTALAPIVAAASGSCRAARAREGAVLIAEIAARLDGLERGADAIGALAPMRVIRERDRLAAHVKHLLDGREIEDFRVAQEIALAADRLDITEELVRFRAHLDAAREAIRRDGPLGKHLGFVAQEMGREVNTIGAKANDATIAHEVVAMKSELEKIREQLENLE